MRYLGLLLVLLSALVLVSALSSNAGLLVWYGSGCWEAADGTYVLVNQTTKTNCQAVESWKAQSAIEAVTVIRRYMAGLPLGN
jgi:hypothetical protein